MFKLKLTAPILLGHLDVLWEIPTVRVGFYCVGSQDHLVLTTQVPWHYFVEITDVQKWLRFVSELHIFPQYLDL